MRFKLRKFSIAAASIFFVIFFISFMKNDSPLSLLKKNINADSNFIQNLPQINIPALQNNPSKVNLNDRIDWHDYEAIKKEQKREGPGEQGVAVVLTQSDRDPSAYKENGFNIRVSDRISLNRSVADIRHPNCKTRKYLRDLPTVSIIIPFHNEGWTTLLRSVCSIINRTPPHLLHEIILIDDYSTKDHLKQKLDKELKKFPKVKLIRAQRREGLIRARLLGVQHATGDVLVILDSHIETSVNWLPPLLEPIAIDRKVVTCPMIDIIDKENFRYLTQPGDAQRGAFDWELYYKRIPIPDEKLPADPSDPFEDPVMAGGLFAIDRLYFNEIGLYDPGLEIWGGEQYELSFKVWMCGGKILDTPCSRIGHIYRKFMPYSLPKGTSINKNYKRVIEVWMDEYKEYFYKRRPFVRSMDAGNLQPQKDLRNKLQCKSFKWYMTEVAPDIVKYYPPVYPSPAASGKLKNVGLDLCVDTRHGREGEKISLGSCDGRGELNMLLTWQEDIRPGKDMISARAVCFDGQGAGRSVIIWNCHGQHGNQLWKYHNKQLLHSVTDLCAEANSLTNSLMLVSCDKYNMNQIWEFDTLNTTMLEKLNKNLRGPS